MWIDRYHYHAWNNKGAVLQEVGKREEGLRCFDRALEVDPLCVPAWYNKGNLNFDNARYDDAIECYDKALPFPIRGDFVFYARVYDSRLVNRVN